MNLKWLLWVFNDPIKRLEKWVRLCFGPNQDIINHQESPEIRDLRFFEEVTELVQAGTISREKAIEVINYVYDRERGVVDKEAGQVIVAFLNLCRCRGIDVIRAANTEINRINTVSVISRIRFRQATKPKPETKQS